MGFLEGFTTIGLLKRILIYVKSMAKSQARQADSLELLVKMLRLTNNIELSDLEDIDKKAETQFLQQSDEDLAKIEFNEEWALKHGRKLKADEMPLDPFDYEP